MNLVRQIIIIFLASLALACINYAYSDKINTSQENEIAIEQALQKTDVRWIDARESDAYDLEHIPKAILLNESDWDQLIEPFLNNWNPDMTVIVYCSNSTCNASQSVAQRLSHDFGIPNVYVLKNGWNAWKNRTHTD